MSRPPIDPDTVQRTAEYRSQRILNIATILLILAFGLFFCQLINVGAFRAKASGVDRLPISIRASSQADYSSNDQDLAIPPIAQNIIKQIIMDIPGTGTAADRIATLQAALLSVVPTMTSDLRLPVMMTLTPTPTAVDTASALPTSIVMTFAIPTRSLPPTSTVTYIYPTYAPVLTASTKTSKPPTKTFTPLPTFTRTPAITATSASTATSSPAGTSTPTGTSTTTPTFTPTHTATNTPTNTFTFTPINTATWTSTPTGTAIDTPTLTPTSTFTPTAISTPSPTVTLSSGCVAYPTGGFVAIQDTWVDNTNPSTSHESDTTLIIRPTAGIDKRALVAFDLSGIPPGSTVTSAALYLTVTTGGNYNVQFYPITQPWPETVTWNTQPTYDATSAGSFTLTTTVCTRVASFNTSLVTSWIDNPSANYGVYLFPPAGAGQAAFSSREGASAPVLVVNYIP